MLSFFKLGLRADYKFVPPLSEVNALRAETQHATRIWDEFLGPKLGELESDREKSVRIAKSKSTAVAAVGIIFIVFATMKSGVAPAMFYMLTIWATVLAIFAITGVDWLRVFSVRKKTKELVLGVACATFDFSYDTLLPDTDDVQTGKQFRSFVKNYVSKEYDRKMAAQLERYATKPSYDLSKKQAHLENTSALVGAPTPAYAYLVEAGVVPAHAYCSFEDMIFGERAGAKFTLVEANLQTGGKNNSTAFQGVFLNIEYPRRFLGRTIIARNNAFEWVSRPKGLKKIDLVSSEFAQAFSVWSDDEVEARALLTPDRIQRLIQLNRYFDNGRLRGVFEDGHLTLALNAQSDQFEAGSIMEPLVNERRFASALLELSLICDLIDGFMTREWANDRRLA